MEDLTVKVREQGTIKVKYTTAMILAGIIFLASLFSGWITNNKDLDTVRAEQKGLAVSVGQHTGRIIAMEECLRGVKEDTKEMKGDLNEIRQDLKDFYKRAGKSMGIRE